MNRRDYLRALGALSVLTLAPHSALAASQRPSLDSVAKADCIFLGEKHDDGEHHRKQCEIFAEIAGRYPSQLGLALEMVQIPFQAELDRFVAGEFPLDQLSGRLDWKKRWGFDFGMYSPMLELCQKRRLPARAMRFSSESSKKLGVMGFDALEGAEQLGLENIDCNDIGPGGEEALRAVYQSHGPGAIDPEKFRRFVQVQVWWEEGMVSQIAALLEQCQKAVVIVGAGHLTIGHGLQHRLHRRTGASTSVVLFSNGETERQRADLIWS